jgi:hypothetical protein
MSPLFQLLYSSQQLPLRKEEVLLQRSTVKDTTRPPLPSLFLTVENDVRICDQRAL